MDDLTERIVSILRADGRTPHTVIAKRLGVSRDYVAERVRGLMESGRLRIVAGIHPNAVGLAVAAHLAIRVRGPIGGVLTSLEEIESIGFISTTTGSYQIAAEIWLPSLTDLHEHVATIQGLPNVVEVQTHLYDEVITSFFTNGAPTAGLSSLDGTDRRILAELQRDGRASFVDIAVKVGLSTSGCRMRVQRLIASGVAKVGAIDRHTQDAEELLFGVGINVTGETSAVEEVLRATASVEFVARTIGRFGLIATAAVSSVHRLNMLVTQLRELDAVSSTEVWLHLAVARERYERDLIEELGAATG